MNHITDIGPYIKAKSDQLNADDLISGPITVQVEGVVDISDAKGKKALIKISGGHMPFKPCKTVLRILAAGWGGNPSKWVGRWMELYRDESVRWAGEEVGGIRVSAMSHIDRPLTLNLAVSQGKKKSQHVKVLKPTEQRPAGKPTAKLADVLEENDLTEADVNKWLEANDKPGLDGASDDKRAALAAFLVNNPERIEQIRALNLDNLEL